MLGRSHGWRRPRSSDLTGVGAPIGHCWSAPRPGGADWPKPVSGATVAGSGQGAPGSYEQPYTQESQFDAVALVKVLRNAEAACVLSLPQ